MVEFLGESLYHARAGEIYKIFQDAMQTSSWPDVCTYVTKCLEELGFVPTFGGKFRTDKPNRLQRKEIGHDWPSDPVTQAIVELTGAGLNRFLEPSNQFRHGIVLVDRAHPLYNRYIQPKK